LSSKNNYGEDLKRTESEPLRKALAATNLLAFTEYLGYVNPPYLETIYRILQRSDLRRLIVILPPGFGKSTSVTINYPLWRIGQNHNLRFITASHTKDFVASFLRAITAWMQNPRYIEIFGDLRPTRPSLWTQNEVIVLRDQILKDPTLTALGIEQATIGRRTDYILGDDLIDEDWASSEALRAYVRTWFKKELLERLDPDGQAVIVGTRWHYDDLYGELLEEKNEKGEFIWERLIFPAIGEENHSIWEERWPLVKLLTIKDEVGEIVWSCQWLHDPTPVTGEVFKETWFHYWDYVIDNPEKKIFRLPPLEKLLIFQGWDLGISEDPSADWTVGLTLGISQDEKAAYVLEYERKHLDFPAQVSRVQALADAWNPSKIGIEATAYQRALAQTVRRSLHPVVPVEQTKNKKLRITGLTPFFQNGTIRINRAAHSELIKECLQFPKGKHEDVLDALEIAFRIAQAHVRPGASLFEPPSAYRDFRREDDRERFRQR
jgi:predicted phage terminase large subunit-like protein